MAGRQGGERLPDEADELIVRDRLLVIGLLVGDVAERIFALVRGVGGLDREHPADVDLQCRGDLARGGHTPAIRASQPDPSPADLDVLLNDARGDGVLGARVGAQAMQTMVDPVGGVGAEAGAVQ